MVITRCLQARALYLHLPSYLHGNYLYAFVVTCNGRSRQPLLRSGGFGARCDLPQQYASINDCLHTIPWNSGEWKSEVRCRLRQKTSESVSSISEDGTPVSTVLSKALGGPRAPLETSTDKLRGKLVAVRSLLEFFRMPLFLISVYRISFLPNPDKHSSPPGL